MDEQASNNGRRMFVRVGITSTLRVPDEHATIQGALDEAVDGDVVVVADGIYRGDGNRDLNMKGKAIHLKSENGPKHCIIDCQGTSSDRHRGFTFEMGEDYRSIVDGFTIMNGNMGLGAGVSCYESSPLIMNCIFFGNAGNAIRYYSGSNVTVANCVIVGNHGGSSIWGSEGNPKIINSTIAMNTSTGYAAGIMAGIGKLTLVNSIVWGNRDKSGNGPYSQILTLGPETFSPKHKHTYYHNCIEGWGTDPNGVGNFESDPLFVDSIDGDFHLTAGSPCVDRGDPDGNYLADVVSDFEGDKRISFGRIDVGADEYLSCDLWADGSVDLADLAALSAYWEVEGCPEQEWCGFSDFTSDGRVDVADLWVLAEKWLEESEQAKYVVKGYWKIDDMSGQTALDNSPYGRSGTLLNMDDDDWVGGKVGGALSFDGVDDYVQIEGWKGILGAASRTVCAWIKTTATGSANIVYWGDTGASNDWLLFAKGDMDGKLALTTNEGYVVGTSNVCDGEWHHVAAVLENDGTPDAAEVRLYVDGVEDAITLSQSAGVDTPVGSDVLIGSNGVQYFEGLIDEVRIYDRALSGAEVAELAEQ